MVYFDRTHQTNIRSVNLNADEMFEINIHNQAQLDNLELTIKKAIKGVRTSIKVHIFNGIYMFKEAHISFTDMDCPNVSIMIEGSNAVLTSDNNYLSQKNVDYGISGDFLGADSLIDVVDRIENVCYIPYKNNFSKTKAPKYKTVKIPQWYKSINYPIVDINGTGIFFKANNLTVVKNRLRKSYNVNYDYVYHAEKIRFVLFDESNRIDSQASNFIYLDNSNFKSLIIKGLIFNSNNDGSSLLYFNNVNAAQICIADCQFINIRSIIASFIRSNNVVVNNNHVSNLKGNGFCFSSGCSGVVITKNFFRQCGLDLNNSFCIRCNEAEYFISDNTFEDFGYGAIAVGLWHGENKEYPSRGIIEHNEIYYTPSYNANYWKHTLMDSGAIYSWTQNDGTIIRYNYIHDITGMWENRGIFCDDGASNMKIYGNIILNIRNNYCIDSRRVRDYDIKYNISVPLKWDEFKY